MRGRAMAIFMAATTFGPVLGPMISGFVSTVTWRWTFWTGLILAGATWIPLLFLPETYGPIILKHRAEEMRKSSGKSNAFAPIELETKGFSQLMTVTLTRPIRMFINEALVFFTCIYLSFAYAIFYLFFEAYPIIFQDMYNMKAGIAGLAFLPIGIGALVACAIFFIWDSFLYKAKKANTPWASIEENRRLPLACIGGPLYVVSLFWLGWAANPTTHWIVPMLAGVPFGIGFLLVFIALLNYLTDAYEVFAASAMAAASCCRSIFGAALPFAAHPMYDRLGIHWATSLVAFLSLAMCIIPFAFIKYGDQIRDNSLFCRYLKETREREGKEQESQQLGQEK
ncbi:MAG: hypothetical protein M1825_004639 [Sarcosagium campestre]|nr:MAG: hypothetical protein M1825_004639 [Sarcosagium campestre]